MRFISKEKVITTVCDKNFDDIENIKRIATYFLSHKISFSICYKREINYDVKTCQHEKAYIKTVNENTIDIIVVGHSNVVIRGIEFQNIVSVECENIINKILELQDENISRWEYLIFNENKND